MSRPLKDSVLATLSFPPEVLSRIFNELGAISLRLDQLSERNKQLRTVALVSKMWRACAHEVFFAHLAIPSWRYSSHSKIIKTLKKKSAVYETMRSVSIHFMSSETLIADTMAKYEDSKEYRDEIADEFEFDSSRGFIWYEGQEMEWKDYRDARLEGWARERVLASAEGAWTDTKAVKVFFLDILGKLKNLRHLYITGMHSHLPSKPATASKLAYLGRLRTLSWTRGHSSNGPPVGALLPHITNIQNLTISRQAFEYEPTTLPAFHALTFLRIISHPHPARRIVGTFDTPDQVELQEIIEGSLALRTLEIGSEDLAALAGGRGNVRLAHLTRLRVDVPLDKQNRANHLSAPLAKYISSLSSLTTLRVFYHYFQSNDGAGWTLDDVPAALPTALQRLDIQWPDQGSGKPITQALRKLAAKTTVPRIHIFRWFPRERTGEEELAMLMEKLRAAGRAVEMFEA